MHSARMAICSTAFVFAAGCASVPLPGAAGPAMSGEVALSGPTFGETTQRLTDCVSGEHQVYLGADFSGPGPLVVRLAVDPLTGPGLRVFDPQEPYRRAIVIRQSECEGFHFSLSHNGWRINDVYVLKLSLDVDCTLPSGDHVRAEVTGASCV